MITLRCKMCGAPLNIEENCTVANCEYCGTTQTLPKLDDEKKAAMFDRANYSRSINEFDKASLIYESIISECEDDAEAYWGLCLCRYGIEYVVDPRTKKRIPTCHRTQFKSILEDSDYLKALKYADFSAKDVYMAEAEYIDKVQKEILSISAKEEPFDIFICYKETDENGDRTTDSVIAQDIYSELTKNGYKVFFARITLEDKLGTFYEPYIFSALNSSKIMLVISTKPEYYNAVWVKNEWSRYLSLMEQGQQKTLIPCYRDMSISDMPGEFAALQALDVSKIGYMQDLVRGISKIMPKNSEEKTVSPPPQQVYTPVSSLIKPELISHIQSAGANSDSDFWPKSPLSSTINKSVYKTVSFQAVLNSAIGVEGNIPLEFTVFDELGNTLCHDITQVYAKPDNDRFAKIWILRGDDGSSVEDGNYKVVMSINGSAPVEYRFKITSSEDIKAMASNLATTAVKKTTDYLNVPKQNGKSLGVYLILCLFLGFFGVHSFYAGNKGKGILQLVLSFTGISQIWMIIDLVKGIVTKEVPQKK